MPISNMFLDRYLMSAYDDESVHDDELSPLEVQSFVREEEIDCEPDKQNTEVCNPTDDGIKTWIEKMGKRNSYYAGITVADVRSYTDILLDQPKSQAINDLVLEQPGVSFTEVVGDFVSAQPSNTGIIPAEMLPKNVFHTIYVGNHLVPKNHDADVIRFASPRLPSENQFMVPLDKKEKMKVTLTFRNVDYYQHASEKLKRPTHAWIVPRDFRFELSETGDVKNIPLSDLKNWVDYLKTAEAPSLEPVEGKEPEYYLKYFHRIDVAKKGNSTFALELPPAEYRIKVVSGEALEQKGVSDYFDNIALDIAGENVAADPELNTPIDSTLILGEEIDKVTVLKPDGSREPIPGRFPSTADSGKYLYAEAYAKYHTNIGEPGQMPHYGSRTFKTEKDKKYVLHTKISGIDIGGTLNFKFSDGTSAIYKFSNYKLRSAGLKVVDPDFEVYPDSIRFRDKDEIEYQCTKGRIILPNYFKCRRELSEQGKVTGVEGFNDNGTFMRIRAESFGGRHYLSLWQYDGQLGTFKLAERQEYACPHKMADVLAAYQNNNTMTKIDNIGERMTETIVHMSSRQIVEIPFAAAGESVEILFTAAHRQACEDGIKHTTASDGSYLGCECDEMRFDEIALFELDQNDRPTGNIVRPFK